MAADGGRVKQGKMAEGGREGDLDVAACFRRQLILPRAQSQGEVGLVLHISPWKYYNTPLPLISITRI